jgi:hypothetical protein
VAAKGKVWSSQAQTCVHNSKSKHQAQQQLFDLLMKGPAKIYRVEGPQPFLIFIF